MANVAGNNSWSDSGPSTMVRADVSGGAQFRRPVTMPELLAAGVKFDAETDDDLGEDVCRIVCSVESAGWECESHFYVEFLQASLSASLPRWVRDRTRNDRAIARMFTSSEHMIITEYVDAYDRELAADHARNLAEHEATD